MAVLIFAQHSTTSFLYDVSSGLPVVLLDATRKYVWGAGGLAHETDLSGNVQSIPLVDGLGSVRALTDGTGVLVQTYRTDPFGVPTATQGTSTQPFHFTGEQVDSTGLVYLQARMYDPSSGRFLQKDPLPKSGSGITGWNRYAYVGDNPTIGVDPSGQCADPAPGGGGVHYCVERFIQEQFAGPVLGDNRQYDPAGGTYRTQQLLNLRPDGTTGYFQDAVASVAEINGNDIPGQGLLGRCEHAETKSRVLFDCVGYNGFGRLAVAPIRYTLLIERDANSFSRVILARGTPYPDLEVYQYADDENGQSVPDLVYYYNSKSPINNSIANLYGDASLVDLQPSTR